MPPGYKELELLAGIGPSLEDQWVELEGRQAVPGMA
jgi:hypothetical protein